jgi:hypothetical protein
MAWPIKQLSPPAPHGVIGDRSLCPSDAAAHATGGRTEAIQAVVGSGGGIATTPGDRLASTVAAAPMG